MTKHLYYWTRDVTYQSSVHNDCHSSKSVTTHSYTKAKILFTETDVTCAPKYSYNLVASYSHEIIPKVTTLYSRLPTTNRNWKMRPRTGMTHVYQQLTTNQLANYPKIVTHVTSSTVRIMETCYHYTTPS